MRAKTASTKMLQRCNKVLYKYLIFRGVVDAE
nr:MAG TPA: hypothetical protein [Caudoviricetes sp.]